MYGWAHKTSNGDYIRSVVNYVRKTHYFYPLFDPLCVELYQQRAEPSRITIVSEVINK